jgi:hypothetical protein
MIKNVWALFIYKAINLTVKYRSGDDSDLDAGSTPACAANICWMKKEKPTHHESASLELLWGDK